MTVKIQIRRDNSAVWKTLNPVLSAGEQGLELDTGRTKFGDGVTPWNGRPYAYGSSPEDTNKTVWGDIIGTLAAQEDLKTILDSKLGRAEKGEAGGVAPLDGTGVIPDVHIPNLFPSGGIIMWSGAISAIPIGWALCDGENGTPNLLDRFITGVATASSNPGDTGGANALALTANNMPAHAHTIGSHKHTLAHTHTTAAHAHAIGDHTHAIAAHTHAISLTAESAGSHTHALSSYIDGSGPSSIGYTATKGVCNTNSVSSLAAGAHTHPVSGTSGSATPTAGNTTPSCSSTGITVNACADSSGEAAPTCSAAGSGAAFDNRPAFFALAFIMKL